MKDAARLWKWFQENARDLPWRKTGKDGKRNPYHVWLAEIMLQQTQVATVIPYYEKFLRHYPTLKRLADAPSEQILSDWAGLGYYSRARNLHKCAQVVTNELKGQWSRSAQELQQLPGLGSYTAAAMAALAFGENILAIDGNVARVLSRYGAIKTPVTKARTELLTVGAGLLYAPANGGSAEALIEHGALICTPRNPKCNICPIQKNCKAHAEDNVLAYPVKIAAKAAKTRNAQAVVLTNPSGEIFAVTRGNKGLFAGMLALPGSAMQGGEEDHALFGKYYARAKTVGAITHVLTHIKFEMDVRHMPLSAAESRKLTGGIWLRDIKKMPKLFQKAAERYQGAE